MAYQSVHTGPEVDAAVSVLSDVQDIRDEVETNLNTVTTLAGQTATNAGLAQTAATNAQADAASALTSKNDAHTSAQTAGAHAANADSARALAVVARNGAEQAQDSAWEAEEEVRYLLGESEATIDSIRAEILRQKYGAGPYPSLDIGMVGANVLDRRVTFTRASTATYWDSLGVLQTAGPNEPRFDYDPVTGESLGLLVEGKATNLVLHSQNFGSSYWSKTRIEVSSSMERGIFPDSTAWAISSDSSNGPHEIFGDVTGVIGRSYAISVIAKQGSFPRIRVAGRTSGNWSVSPQGVFDLSSGTAISSSGEKPASMKHLGRGYYLCTVYGTCINGTNIGMITGPVPAGVSSNNFDGSVYSGDVYVCAAQMEEGLQPTSYIKTEASQVTRASDTPNIFSLQESDWFNQREGTIFVEYVYGTITNNACPIGLHDGTGNNRITLAATEVTDRFIVSVGGVSVFNQGFLNYAPGQLMKRALAYDASGIKSVGNGGTVSSGPGAPVPLVTTFSIGYAGYFGNSQIEGHIKRVAFFSRAFHDAKLVELTTV